MSSVLCFQKQIIVMQQAENGGEEAMVDVQFTDLPNALIACKIPEDLFSKGSLQVRTTCSKSDLVSATCTNDVFLLCHVHYWGTGSMPNVTVVLLDV